MDDPVETFRAAFAQALIRVPETERADAMAWVVDQLLEGDVDVSPQALDQTSPWTFSHSMTDQTSIMDLILEGTIKPDKAETLESLTWRLIAANKIKAFLS